MRNETKYPSAGEMTYLGEEMSAQVKLVRLRCVLHHQV